jgi:hypothetical protein
VDALPATPAFSGQRLLICSSKYDGALHRREPARVISDDGRLIVTAGRPRSLLLSSLGLHRGRYDVLAYYWRDRWYNVLRLSEPGGPLALWYCNVATPALLDGSRLRYVDLDLDVALWADGRIEVLDEDEFADHRVAFRYPAHVVEAALGAVGELCQLAEAAEFPFLRP